MSSRTQIIATIGPSSSNTAVLKSMIKSKMDIARINFAWFDSENEEERIEMVRSVSRECGRTVPIIADLPGARVQEGEGHTYDASLPFSITARDEEMLIFCRDKNIEYIALSFVGSDTEVEQYRDAIKKIGGQQKIIAKIERKVAVDSIDEILAVSDAVMIARGDLGKEVPLEEIPFVQKTIISKANSAGKPVIVATQMLLSMTENIEPTRAEVTDVEEAVHDGADAVMLSEETASGHFPSESVSMMERILTSSERHYVGGTKHSL